ncbi:MAG: class I SAM-dependent methyltransferase [Actinomycetota bacterium]
MFTKSARFYDAIYEFKDYAAESEGLHELIQERKPRARTLLDVACGTGHHLEYLSKSYEAEGLDIDEELLAIARHRLPGTKFHRGDMTDFDLGRTFDAVTCLFSSIGYAQTEEALSAAMAAMARHLSPGGVLLVEPWLTPESFEDGHVGSVFVDHDDLKIARLNTTGRDGDLSMLHFAYLVATPDEISHFTEDHVLALFSEEQYRAALEATGLAVEHDPEGPMGRGLYIGTASSDA